MIKNWERIKDDFRGVFVFLINDGQAKFWRSNKRKPYLFAVAEDLYVPVIMGSRITEMEAGWLADQERALARIVEKAHRKENPFSEISSMELTRVEMSLFALELRSRYELEMIRSFVEENDHIRDIISANPERETQRLVLENLIHYVTELHGNHVPLSFIFLHTKNTKFILTDRPSIVVDGIGRFLILSDRLAVQYSKSEGTPSVEHQDIENDFVSLINKMLSIKARDWIVADNEQTIQECIAINSSSEADENRATERCEITKPESLLSGFSFREPANKKMKNNLTIKSTRPKNRCALFGQVI